MPPSARSRNPQGGSSASPPGENIHERLTPAAARQMQEAIAETGGREVFFAGALDGKGLVESVRVCARGTENAVPALFEGLRLRDVVLHNHPSGDLAPSDPDLDLAAIYSAHGHGVYIVDNDVTRVYVVVEPFLPDQATPLDARSLGGGFAPNGAMARVLPQFEVRPQQRDMMEAVVFAFNRDGIAVIEAPTGVGKTLAYLLPAAKWAVQNRERIVVSTRTINLQEQIVLKDIPLLQRCIPEKFSACLVKGRGNYLCLRKLQRALDETQLFDDEETRKQIETLAEWADTTKDGSKADLPFVPGRELWERVCSEADTCHLGRCPEKGRCFVGRARRDVAKADIVVANHHMLFSDIAIKQELGDFSALSVLPSYSRVIFDEAHSIEDSATEYFGANVTQAGFLSALGRLFRLERGRDRGIIPLIKARLVKNCPQVSVSDYEKLQRIADDHLLPAHAVCREAITAAFAGIRIHAAKHCGAIGRDIKWRLIPAVLAEPAMRVLHDSVILPAVDHARTLVRHCDALLRGLDAIPPIEDEQESAVAGDAVQLRAYTRRIERAANVLAECTSAELQENTVRWIEIDATNDGVVRLVRCPLEVSKPLSEWVYENLKTVVMTSATLTVQREFHYLFSRLGLDRIDRSRIHTLSLDSPFNYPEQALLGIPGDLPDPGEAAFRDASVDCVREILRITRGHAFVLYTSYQAMDHAFRVLEKELRTAGITPLKQGLATRTQLLDRFRSDTTSVLFATDSFWEGVDVAGESLQCVILPKLPFRVPTEPILEARAEAIEAAGGNAFMEFSVPQAVIKFRQGFGRLIRRKSDRGAVIVLDRRILTKRYGRVFLDSLPELRVAKGPRRAMLLALTQFFSPPDAESGAPANPDGNFP